MAILFNFVFFILKSLISSCSIANAFITRIPESDSCNFEFITPIASCLFFPERFNFFEYFFTTVIKTGATIKIPKVNFQSILSASPKQITTLKISGIILNVSFITLFILFGSVTTFVMSSPILALEKYSISSFCIFM